MAVGSPEFSPLMLDDDHLLARPYLLDGPDRARDRAAWRELDQDPETARFLGWTVESAKAMPDSHYDEIAAWFAREWDEGKRFSLTIRRRADRCPVGFVELRPQGEQANLSYMVGRELRGRGIAPAAVMALLGWAAGHLEPCEVLLNCHVENTASRRVAEKCGFTFVEQVDDELRFRRLLSTPIGREAEIPPTWALRPAHPSDERFLVELHRATMREYVDEIWRWDDDDQARRHAHRLATLAPGESRWVVEVADEPIGLLEVQRRENVLYLSAIEIAPEWQGRGVGTSIVRWIKEEAARQKQEVQLRVLRSNPRAARFYEREGFVLTTRMETHSNYVFSAAR